VAEDQGRDVTAVWQAIERQPARLSVVAQKVSLSKLAGFFRRAPPSVIKIALASFRSSQWDNVPKSEPFVGATWVASHAAYAGRDDLKSALVMRLLTRATPLDFPAVRAGSLSNLAWLLMNVPSDAEGSVPSFLEAICTRAWLQTLYTKAQCGGVAKGLRLLGLHQPPEIVRRFRSPSLALRLERELFRFGQITIGQQIQLIQLLGSSTLCGWLAEPRWFTKVALGSVAALPIAGLAHRPDADKVEDWQFQLWLGLRAVTATTGQAIPVSSDVILTTLRLWRANLVDASTDLKSYAYRVHHSMVAWLEICSRSNRGLVPPST
jgi:hypothetical protein